MSAAINVERKRKFDALPDEAKRIAEHFIGKKVRLKDNHPHADRVGTVDSLDRTHAGYGFKIVFPDGEGTYVFNQRDWEVLP